MEDDFSEDKDEFNIIVPVLKGKSKAKVELKI